MRLWMKHGQVAGELQWTAALGTLTALRFLIRHRSEGSDHWNGDDYVFRFLQEASDHLAGFCFKDARDIGMVFGGRTDWQFRKDYRWTDPLSQEELSRPMPSAHPLRRLMENERSDEAVQRLTKQVVNTARLGTERKAHDETDPAAFTPLVVLLAACKVVLAFDFGSDVRLIDHFAVLFGDQQYGQWLEVLSRGGHEDQRESLAKNLSAMSPEAITRSKEQYERLHNRVRWVSAGEMEIPMLREADEEAEEAAARRVMNALADLQLRAGPVTNAQEDQPLHPIGLDAAMARAVFELAVSQTDDAQDAIDLIGLFVSSNHLFDYEGYENARRTLARESGFRLVWLGQWFKAGLPQVRVRPDLASALIFTDVTDDVLATMRAPWVAFKIVVAPGLIPTTGNASIVELGVQLVHHLGEPVWGFYALDTAGERGETTRASLPELAHWSPDEADDRESKPKKRVATLVGRLICGVIALSNEHHGGVTRRKAKGSPKWTISRTPVPADYVIGRDVKIQYDLSQAVREYALGTAPRLRAIRWPVRGHMRWQAHGPKLSLRRQMWIQPYWKGEGAMMLRTHEFATPPEDTAK
jgi:hypothetical protein